MFLNQSVRTSYQIKRVLHQFKIIKYMEMEKMRFIIINGVLKQNTKQKFAEIGNYMVIVNLAKV
jgi:hypothetical protein